MICIRLVSFKDFRGGGSGRWKGALSIVGLDVKILALIFLTNRRNPTDLAIIGPLAPLPRRRLLRKKIPGLRALKSKVGCGFGALQGCAQGLLALLQGLGKLFERVQGLWGLGFGVWGLGMHLNIHVSVCFIWGAESLSRRVP